MSRTNRTIKKLTSEKRNYNYQTKDSKQTQTKVKAIQANEDPMRPTRAQRGLRWPGIECQWQPRVTQQDSWVLRWQHVRSSVPLSHHKVSCLKQSASADQLRPDNLLCATSLSTKNMRATKRAALFVSLAHRPLPLAEERQAYHINNSI